METTKKIKEFYHGTSEQTWSDIQIEGVLFGKRPYAKSRCTYLTPDIEEAKRYGDVVLRVLYDPAEHPDMNNYVEGCWQFRVYEPISLIKVFQVL